MKRTISIAFILILAILLLGYVLFIKEERKVIESEKFSKAIEKLIKISNIISSCEKTSKNYYEVITCSNEILREKFDNIFIFDKEYYAKDKEYVITFSGRKGLYKIVIYKDGIIIDNYKYIKFFIGKDVKIYGLLGNAANVLCKRYVTRSDYYINDGNLSLLVKGLWLETIAKGIKKAFVEIYGKIEVRNSCIYLLPKRFDIENISKPKFIIDIFYKNGTLIITTPHPGHKIYFEKILKEDGLNKIFLKYIPPEPDKFYPQVLKLYKYEVKVKGWLLVYINENLVFAKYI